MPYSITTKDGITIRNIPDDVDPSSQALKDRVAAIRSGQPQEKAAPQRSGAQEAGRQVGLTARYSIEGVAGGAGAFIDPVIMAIGGAVRSATGSDYDPATLARVGTMVADALGLPQPETSEERIVGAITRGVAGGGSGAATAAQAAKATTGGTQQVARQLAQAPGVQAASGAAAGGAGQAVAEEGGSSGEQLAAALAAGIAVPGAAGAAARARQPVPNRISPEQQAILDAGERANVPVLTSDVLPPKTFVGRQGQAVGERIPVVGTGAVREGQQAARQEAVSNLAQQYPAPSYEAMVSSIKGKVGSIKRAAGSVIDKTGQQLDQAGTVAPSRAVAAIDDAIAKLSNANVKSDGAAKQVQYLQELKDTLSNGSQTFSTLRQNRTNLKEYRDAVDPADRSQLPSYAKKLVTNVYNAIRGDMDEFARANLPAAQVAKLERANKVYGDEAQLLKASRLKNVLDKGDITPEVVRNMIYSNKPSENRILYGALGAAGRQQVKSALINDAATKALRNGEINPNAFGAELAKHDAKLNVFFKGEEREAIGGFVKLLQATRRAQTAADTPTTTGATLYLPALGAAAWADFGATLSGAIATGGLARLYESPGVRNLLLKLNASARGSQQESKYLQGIVAAIREDLQRQERQRQKDRKNERPAPRPQQQPTF